jgi:hypothetical protein
MSSLVKMCDLYVFGGGHFWYHAAPRTATCTRKRPLISGHFLCVSASASASPLLLPLLLPLRTPLLLLPPHPTHAQPPSPLPPAKQTVSLIAYLMQHKGNHGPFLVVSPMALLRNNWQYEFERWLPHCRTVVYDGDRDQRKVLRYSAERARAARDRRRSNQKFTQPIAV